MLGRQCAGLGAVAVKQALTHHAAAGKGLQTQLGMVTHANALRVYGGIEKNLDTKLLMVIHKVVPQNRPSRCDQAAAQ